MHFTDTAVDYGGLTHLSHLDISSFTNIFLPFTTENDGFFFLFPFLRVYFQYFISFLTEELEKLSWPTIFCMVKDLDFSDVTLSVIVRTERTFSLLLSGTRV